jgi:hypothetical protein
MIEEQLHTDVVAELFWGPEGRQRGKSRHPRFASSPPTRIIAITLDKSNQFCNI